MSYDWSDNDYIEQLRRRRVNLLRMSDRVMGVDNSFAQLLSMKARQIESILHKFIERRAGN